MESIIAIRMRVYQLLFRYMEPKTGADLVFTTEGGEKVTHVAIELEKLGERFGKRKQIATSVGQTGTDADVRAIGKLPSTLLNKKVTRRRGITNIFLLITQIHPVESDGLRN